jgi:hypothetical protein
MDVLGELGDLGGTVVRGELRSVRRAIPLVIAAVALVATLLGAPVAHAEEPLVLVYGDSLLYESQPFAEQLLGQVGHVEFHVGGFGGAATCDFQSLFEQDAAKFHPVAVVLSFSGNAISPCMRNADGSFVSHDEWLRRYREDTIKAIATFRPGSPQIWLGTAPISRDTEAAGDYGVFDLAQMYRDLAAANPRVHVAESGDAVMWNRHWARWLPCLASEPCEGGVDVWGRPVNFVRNQWDGAHFCPAPFPVLARCPVYASGAMRYAGGLLIPVLRSMGRFDLQRAAGTYYATWPN